MILRQQELVSYGLTDMVANIGGYLGLFIKNYIIYIILSKTKRWIPWTFYWALVFCLH